LRRAVRRVHPLSAGPGERRGAQQAAARRPARGAARRAGGRKRTRRRRPRPGTLLRHRGRVPGNGRGTARGRRAPACRAHRRGAAREPVSPPTAIALSASGATFSVAARRAGGPVFVAACAGREQSARATDLLDDVLARAGATREDVSEVRVDRGPGSYTGLRMAIAFARVLAAFGAVQLRAATSLELIALAAWRGGIDAHRAVRPVLDARRGRAHTARIERREGRGVLATAPIAVPEIGR